MKQVRLLKSPAAQSLVSKVMGLIVLVLRRIALVDHLCWLKFVSGTTESVQTGE